MHNLLECGPLPNVAKRGLDTGRSSSEAFPKTDRLKRSTAAYTRIYPPIADAILLEEDVAIAYVNFDTPHSVAA